MNSAPGEEAFVYLRTYLAPFQAWLDDPTVTDILVNRPGEAFIERQGAPMLRVAAPDLTPVMLQRLAQQIAAAASQGVSRERPLLGAALPGGARVQVAAPPATRGGVALAIRKHVVSDLSLDECEREGVFSDLRPAGAEDEAERVLAGLLAQGRYSAFLKVAVAAGRTILISGGTGAGKTTFLNALLKEAPPGDRIIVIEDAPEIQISQANALGLVAAKGEQGEARVSVEDLLQAALRMRPDRLLVGEIRGAEAFTFLRAVNTGHPGSMTTIHADSPEGALDQLAFMALQAGVNLTRADVKDYAARTIDVIVQLSRAQGRRRVTHITHRPRQG